MEIDSCCEDKLEAYSVLFNKCRFGFTSNLNMEDLKFFSIQNQSRLGKIDVKVNINAIRYVKNNMGINYLVMTEYQQIIPLIYFLRSQPSNCKIITTKIMIQLAKIYAQDFYRIVKKINQVISEPTYEEESSRYDNYQLQFQIDFQSWASIFSKEEIHNFVNRCIGLNYRQKYDTQRGVSIVPYPSGINLGSAVWYFQNTQTKNNFLWVQGISHHRWRACQSFNVNTFQKQIKTVVFTNQVLSNPLTRSNQDEHQCLQFLKAVFQRLSKGNNIRLVLKDILIITDIINYIAYEFKDKLKKIFFTGVSINHTMSYANSYPEFLTVNHQKRIYEDPPVFPFETYELMKEKIISQGTLEEVSSEKKVPVKQLILRSTPYIHFLSDFHALLIEGQSQVAEIMCEKFYDVEKLRQFLQQIKIEKLIFICKRQEDIKNIPDLGQPFALHLFEQQVFIPDDSLSKYYTVEGCVPQLLCRYTKRNGWLKLEPIEKIFRQISLDWAAMLAEQLQKNGIRVLKMQQDSIKTEKSLVRIEQYQLKITTEEVQQLKLVNNFLTNNSKLFSLNPQK